MEANEIDKNESFATRGRDVWSFRTYGVLLLLDLDDGAVLEGPLDNVGLLRRTLDVLGAAEGRPELGEVLDLDQVPDVGQRGADDGRLADGGGGGDGRHFEVCLRCLGELSFVLLVLRRESGRMVFCVAVAAAISVKARNCQLRGLPAAGFLVLRQGKAYMRPYYCFNIS
jgi:hypothetical protein